MGGFVYHRKRGFDTFINPLATLGNQGAHREVDVGDPPRNMTEE